MIRVPRFKMNDVVSVYREKNIEPVKIQATLIHVEEQEIHYKCISDIYSKSEEFIINEDDILQGYDTVPCPAFCVGDFITYHHTIIKDGVPENEVREGIIEEVSITFDERGYHIYYKTDEHSIGDCVLEDDILEKDFPEIEEDKEDNYGIVY